MRLVVAARGRAMSSRSSSPSSVIDPHIEAVDEHQHPRSGEPPPEPDVVEPAVVAQRDDARDVDPSRRTRKCPGIGTPRGEGRPSAVPSKRRRGPPHDRPVRVGLRCSRRGTGRAGPAGPQRPARGCLAEPPLERLVEALDLAAGLRVVRARVDRSGSRAARTRARSRSVHRREDAAVNTAPLSVSSDAGNPWAAAASWKLATTSAALNTTRASEATRNREWSSTMFRISTSGRRRSRQWVMSACQRSFGISASNRTNELRGRFCGWGVDEAPAGKDPPDRRDRRARRV